MALEQTLNWQQLTLQGLTTTYNNVLSHLPQLLSAILLVAIGVVIAKMLEYLTKAAVSRLDKLFHRTTGDVGAKKIQIQRSYAYILGKIVFWSCFFIFVDLASRLLGWEAFSRWMGNFTSYLPEIIAAMLILLAGFLLCNFTRTLIDRALLGDSDTESSWLAVAAQWSVMALMVLLAINQTGINITIVTNILVVIIGVALGGAMLALSLGSRSLTANVIGAQYAKSYCRIGMPVKIGNIEGNLLEITQTSLVIQTKNAVAVVPAKFFQDEVCELLDER